MMIQMMVMMTLMIYDNNNTNDSHNDDDHDNYDHDNYEIAVMMQDR